MIHASRIPRSGPKMPAKANPSYEDCVLVTDGYVQNSSTIAAAGELIRRPTGNSKNSPPLAPGESRITPHRGKEQVVARWVKLQSGLQLLEKSNGVFITGPRTEDYFLAEAQLELPKQSDNPATRSDVSWTGGLGLQSMAERGCAIIHAGGDSQVILSKGGTIFFDDGDTHTRSKQLRNHIIANPDGGAVAVDYEFVETGRVQAPSGLGAIRRSAPTGYNAGVKASAEVTREGYLQAKFDGKTVQIRPFVPLAEIHPGELRLGGASL